MLIKLNNDFNDQVVCVFIFTMKANFLYMYIYISLPHFIIIHSSIGLRETLRVGIHLCRDFSYCQIFWDRSYCKYL